MLFRSNQDTYRTWTQGPNRQITQIQDYCAEPTVDPDPYSSSWQRPWFLTKADAPETLTCAMCWAYDE